ncbi:MAG TPA: DNA recombination protein RmuC [Candidatus Acidoferrum sp.]|jgi:DNA recombination protein RmuC
MNAIWIAAAIFAVVMIGLVVWVLVQNTQDQKKNEQLETQMNELRRDLLGLSTAQTQSTTKLETIAEAVNSRLDAVTTAVREGGQSSVAITSKITAEAQNAMSTELKNTREQISQMQKQIGEVQQAGAQMHQTAQTLENILGGTKSRGILGESTLERLLEDSLPQAQFATQFKFRSGEAADAVIFLRDKKLLAIDSKFPLEAFRRLTEEGEDARKTFISAVKLHADSIARKYIVADEGTLDFAMMFVPSESVYYELLMSADHKGMSVDEYCRSKKIVAVSPNTLYAHLCVISMGMRGMQIEENAKQLSDHLRGMRTQLDKFTESFEKVGKHLKDAQQSYNEADKRYDKASNTLDTMLSGAEPPLLELEDVQGTLTLPATVAAKKTA